MGLEEGDNAARGDQLMLADEDRRQSTLAALEILLAELRKRPHEGSLHEDGVRLLSSLRPEISAVPVTHLNLIADLLTLLFSHDFVKHQAIAALSISQLKSRY